MSTPKYSAPKYGVTVGPRHLYSHSMPADSHAEAAREVAREVLWAGRRNIDVDFRVTDPDGETKTFKVSMEEVEE